MVTLQSKVRTKLQTKVFDKIGKTITYSALTAVTEDSRGDAILKSYTDSSVVIVPYDITRDEVLNEQWGDMEGGEMAIAVPYTTTVTVKDRLTIDSVTYEVTDVSLNYLPDNVVTIARIKKVQF